MSTNQLLKQAKKHIIHNELDEAIDIVDDILEDEPTNVTAMLLKSSALQRQKKHEDTVKLLKKVVELDSSAIAGWKGLARSYYLLSQLGSYFNATLGLLYALSKQAREESSSMIEDDAKSAFSKLKEVVQQAQTSQRSSWSKYTAAAGSSNSSNTAQNGQQSVAVVAERLLELQIPPLSTASEEMRAVHVFLESLQAAFDPHALAELIYYRHQSLDQRIAAITARTRQSLGYTLEKAAKDRVKAIDDSHLLELLRMQVNTEQDDKLRRDSESQLLELMVSKLKNVVDSSPNSELKSELVEEIRDLDERMAMFEPAQPLAWELAWDWDLPSLNADNYKAITAKSSVLYNKTKRSRRRAKHGKKNEEDEQSKEGNDEEAHNEEEHDEEHNRDEQEGGEDVGTPVTTSDPSSRVYSLEEAVVRYAEIWGTSNSSGESQQSQQTQQSGKHQHQHQHKVGKQKLGVVFAAFLSRSSSIDKLAKAYTAYEGDSVFGWLLCARFFVAHSRYESAIDAAHHGIEAANRRVRYFQMDMQPAILQFKMVLAESYRNFQAVKNSALASDLYDEVLDAEPQNVEAMVGKALVLAQRGSTEDMDNAIVLLQRVVELHPSHELATAELAWLFVQRGEYTRGIEHLERAAASLQNTPLRSAELHFRIGYALWMQAAAVEADSDAGAEEITSEITSDLRKRSFDSFVAALEKSKNYAPAYTYLGLFFEAVSHDVQRAHRCYYRALELDHGQLLAGERLASDFAEHSQWDLVEVVATTVLSSEKLKGRRDVDWPYRAMGIVCLNQLRFDEAVKFFQKCLRSASGDVQAWIGLGEAYIHSGRYRSAEKALSRALKLDPANFSALYVLSLAQREMLDFPASSASLNAAIEHAPRSSESLLWALADNSLRAADFFIGESMPEDALKEAQRALRAVLDALNICAAAPEESATFTAKSATGILWGTAAEVLLFLTERMRMHESTNKDDYALEQIVADLCTVASIDNGSWSEIAESLALKYVEATAKESKPRRVSAHSIAARALCINNKPEVAIQHFQKGILLEPRNEDLWNAYGVLLISRNPTVSQHCFVRALSINGRNVDTWINLAALYLSVHDAELALEAVERALALDPEHARAWIAQALAETMLHSKPNEHLYRTFEYAYTLSNNDEIANFAFALKEFEMRPETPSPAGLGALEKLLALNAAAAGRSTGRAGAGVNIETAELIMGLLLERRGDYESSIEHLQRVDAWAHIARIQLALKDYPAALESCARVQSDKSNEPSTSYATRMEALSALLTAGLSHFFLNDFDAAIESFTEALSAASEVSDAKGEEDVLRLLVEVLYASQSADARQVAQDQLFASIEENGATLQVTLLLGAIGVLEGDDAVKEAAMHELRALMTPDLHGEALAQTCSVLTLLDPSDRSFERSIFQWPTDYELWRRVNKQQALLIAEGQLRNARQLSRAYMEAGGYEHSQRAVFLDPTNAAAWQQLASEIAK